MKLEDLKRELGAEEVLTEERKRLIKRMYLERIKLEDKGILKPSKNLAYPELYKKLKRAYEVWKARQRKKNKRGN